MLIVIGRMYKQVQAGPALNRKLVFMHAKPPIFLHVLCIQPRLPVCLFFSLLLSRSLCLSLSTCVDMYKIYVCLNFLQKMCL